MATLVSARPSPSRTTIHCTAPVPSPIASTTTATNAGLRRSRRHATGAVRRLGVVQELLHLVLEFTLRVAGVHEPRQAARHAAPYAERQHGYSAARSRRATAAARRVHCEVSTPKRFRPAVVIA